MTKDVKLRGAMPCWAVSLAEAAAQPEAPAQTVEAAPTWLAMPQIAVALSPLSPPRNLQANPISAVADSRCLSSLALFTQPGNDVTYAGSSICHKDCADISPL